jgi:hypothetical protein
MGWCLAKRIEARESWIESHACDNLSLEEALVRLVPRTKTCEWIRDEGENVYNGFDKILKVLDTTR